MYPTAFGKPATVPSPGCVYSHVLGVCVCVCVCVFVCPHVLGRCNDASFHRCISRFTDSTDVSIHSSIHQCIECVRCGSFVILCQYFSILLCSCFVNIGVDFCVILLVLGSIFTSFLCPWASFGDPAPSRAPPRGAEAKM